ncbi:protein kinase domain-containing protein, partial [Gemmatimonas sp.]|uniref:protein kinase domain-containing protein n=1 Tax=Gemmatimonas sp. TaxID=1962908 RepID=UPI003983507B
LADRYRLERALGAGGMATVYLADDLKHDRQVAIKVLKPGLAAVLGAERFVQEIKTTAQLQHPHILPLFDSGEAAGFLYYVMPYIEGETIREALNRETQLGIEEGVRICMQIADALDYAHRRGIIHRDIKPENILLHDGRPMVMDFGIALAVSAAAGGRMTETGLSLGTPHYMSPEQATADRTISARSDVYSLASVLYEMLTGEPPHMGTSAQQIIMKIIAEPVKPATELRKSIPLHVAAALSMALEKLPADRFESAKAFSEALANPDFRTASQTAAGAVAIAPRRRWYASPVPYAAALLLSLAALGWQAAQVYSADASPVRFVVRPPPDGLGADRNLAASISADGRRIAFQARVGNTRRLHVQDLTALDAKPLPGTEEARYFALSPDGRSLVFQPAAGGLRRVAIEAGTVTDMPLPANKGKLLPSGVRFNGDTLVVSLGISGAVLIPSGGGPIHAIAITLNGRPCECARRVAIGPDGKQLFMAGPSLYVVPIEGGEVRDLGVPAELVVGIRNNLLLYLTADGVLMAAPLDVRSLTLGPSKAVEAQITPNSSPVLAENGTLVMFQGASESRLELIDERGTGRPVIDSSTDPRAVQFPRFSPDGKRIAVTTADRRDGALNAVSIIDIASGTITPLTSGFSADRPEWSPDGQRVLFRRFGTGSESIWWQRFDRSEAASALQQPTGDQLFVAEGLLSPNGEHLLFRTLSDKTGRDIWYRAMRGDTTSKPFELTSADEVMPRFSPDGRWVAYTSNETGAPEVFVRPFPGPGGRTQISTNGGSEPVWAPDGTRLFYVSGADFMAASLSTGGELAVRSRSRLFGVDFVPGAIHANYDVAHDGQHFLMSRSTGRPAELTVVLHWLANVQRRMVRGASE